MRIISDDIEESVCPEYWSQYFGKSKTHIRILWTKDELTGQDLADLRTAGWDIYVKNQPTHDGNFGHSLLGVSND